MVNAYWEIGEQIYLACGESKRAEYGKQLLDFVFTDQEEELKNYILKS